MDSIENTKSTNYDSFTGATDIWRQFKPFFWFSLKALGIIGFMVTICWQLLKLFPFGWSFGKLWFMAIGILFGFFLIMPAPGKKNLIVFDEILFDLRNGRKKRHFNVIPYNQIFERSE
ncbi:hypothetical protein EQG49_00250 [Periweissella cryptocerci]|uniref:Uncharacterized protein n=1 Tax=Periweissella cryptocerci TaxID=2506420 RepID=A0A4V1AIC1_9LACO|nr:hypothetical protein [Periweissella cryptocerci]QBO34985.1 hypothetical protein EQG49_00250 [Periweissella cryptocerci]